MLILNKYKIGCDLIFKESLNLINPDILNNQFVNYIFNYKKKLIRNFLFFLFITYFYNFFSGFHFKINPIYNLKLNSFILSLADNNCLDNYHNFCFNF